MEDVDEVEVKKENGLLSPEDAERTGQLAEGVRKIKVCHLPLHLRDHSLVNTYAAQAATFSRATKQQWHCRSKEKFKVKYTVRSINTENEQ
jgi:hypothetical protein